MAAASSGCEVLSLHENDNFGLPEGKKSDLKGKRAVATYLRVDRTTYSGAIARGMRSKSSVKNS